MTGKSVNRQLMRFRAFEAWLAGTLPGLHGRLRRIYNAVGPFAASRIRSAAAADLVYLLLKPAEYMAVFIPLLSSLRGFNRLPRRRSNGEIRKPEELSGRR